MYGPTPSGRTNTKTATDPCRGQILNHKDHNLKKAPDATPVAVETTKIGAGPSTAARTPPNPGAGAATADCKSVLQLCEYRWRRSRKSIRQ